MASKKLLKKELEQIQDIQNRMQAVRTELGQLALAKIDLKNRQTNIENFLVETQELEGKVVKELEEKYGKGSIDLEKGEFKSAEVSLYISSILENLLNIPMGKYTPALNNTFKAIDKSNYVRNWSTALWIKIMSLLQLERKQEAIFYLKKLINLFIYAPYPQSYVLNNRVVEAAVLLNKLEPSEETTLIAKKLFILNSSRFLYDHTESTRERGLIIYDFCKYVLNENI